MKNVIALAAGMSEGLGLGTNAMAALVTRGCSEMRRLVVALGGQSAGTGCLSVVGSYLETVTRRGFQLHRIASRLILRL